MLRDAANFRVLEEIVQHAKLFRAVLHEDRMSTCGPSVPRRQEKETTRTTRKLCKGKSFMNFDKRSNNSFL